ncbi:MAG: poly-gamma-glutamate system protein [Corallococcus sp.]|nr:poly-gamma-glutamate system protein [Corallococcus sp.]
MTSRRVSFATLILAIWMAIVLVAVAVTFFGAERDVSPHAETMTAAAEKAKASMDEIKRYKSEIGKQLSEYDKLQTGMIGYDYVTSITTTSGLLEAKRTSCDANWAAVIVGMFVRAGLKRGDKAVMVFSGSFPAMNICAMAAAETYGIDACIMASVGASNYGANDPELTFFDMAEHLCDAGILTRRIDYVSLGGDMDVGHDFSDEAEKQAIINRINASLTKYPQGSQKQPRKFAWEENFEVNIGNRLEYVREHFGNIGFVLNVGGSMVGVGTGLDAFIGSDYYSPKKYAVGGWNFSRNATDGLLQCGLKMGVPVASILNIRGLAEKYGIVYDPDTAPVLGKDSGCNAYFSTAYDLTLPIIALCLSIGIFVFYYIFKKRYGVEGRKDERNRILCRR